MEEIRRETLICCNYIFHCGKLNFKLLHNFVMVEI